ncbi:MAG TPA: metal-sensitive transcriptional regulator [bacterium]|nr:metal-sensitive transcriptional regulator [bacterium]
MESTSITDHPDAHGPSYAADKTNMLRRLRKIEGQIRGIQRMINDGRYCVDILTQLSAVRSALNKVGLMVLEDHVRGCVTRSIRADGGDILVDELVSVIEQFTR